MQPVSVGLKECCENNIADAVSDEVSAGHVISDAISLAFADPIMSRGCSLLRQDRCGYYESPKLVPQHRLRVHYWYRHERKIQISVKRSSE